MKALFHTLFAYNRWANSKILELTMSLPAWRKGWLGVSTNRRMVLSCRQAKFWSPSIPMLAGLRCSRSRPQLSLIGAPLSHAAIVARELGIPAVVGCGDAMSRLADGDRVRVDGAQGTVEIL